MEEKTKYLAILQLQELNVDRKAVRLIFTNDLNMKKVYKMISENLSGKQKTGKKNRFSHTSPLVRNSDWLWDRGLPLWPRNKMSNLQSKRPVFQKLRSMWILKPCWCDFWYESNYPLWIFPSRSQPNFLSLNSGKSMALVRKDEVLGWPSGFCVMTVYLPTWQFQ